ncbi:uncharacterized protein LOC144083876 [Stigmatopora argus]
MNPFKKKGGKPPAKKSNAAAMRKCREKIKNYPGAYHKYLEKERERYQKRKAQGKIPNIHKLSEREQRQLRRKWKLNQRKQRSKKFQQLEEDLPSTPPPSPDADEFGEPQPGPSQPSTQKKAGRRKTQARDRKAYRTITKNNAQIKQYQTEIRKLKRKISRMQNAQQLSVNVISDSPASKAYSLLSSGNNNRIRKELTFCYAIKDDLKAKHGASVSCDREHLSPVQIRPFANKAALSDYDSLEESTEIFPIEDEVSTTNLKLGDFVLVKYCGKKSVQHFVGKIIQNFDEDDEALVQFMRRKSSVMKKPLFVYPEMDDLDDIHIDNIVMRLPPPTTTGGTSRTGKQHVFDVDLGNYNC